MYLCVNVRIIETRQRTHAALRYTTPCHATPCHAIPLIPSLVELHLDLRGDGRAELVIRQRLPRHPTLGGRVDVVQLPFERSSTEQVQQFMREKLTKVQVVSRARIA